jgi:hypothetical protein
VVRDKVPEVRSNGLTKVFALFAGIFAAIGSFSDGVLGKIDARLVGSSTGGTLTSTLAVISSASGFALQSFPVISESR